METVLIELTVYFDDPFWVGVFQRYTAAGLEAARVVFGSEPKDDAVYRAVLERFANLPFSGAVAAARPAAMGDNPKRMQREAARQLTRTGIGTKAQQALKSQWEDHKLARHVRNREAFEAEMERKFAMRQEKRKQKHKGR